MSTEIMSIAPTGAIDTAAAHCRVCREVISGPHISTETAPYHQQCFVCHHCLEPFPDSVFFEAEGNYYCETDYNMLHGARCAKCGDTIIGKCVSALDAKWHIDHFNCDGCGRSLVGSAFVRKGDRPYCKSCPMDKKPKATEEEKFDATCDYCKKPMLLSDSVTFRGKISHAFHYSCAQCKKTLTPQAREFEDELYCLTDFEKILQNICNACRRPIVGRSISAMGKVYHPEHFVCWKCEKPFDGVTYFPHEGRPYCEVHYKETIGAICDYCHASAKGNVINAMGLKYCEHHFMCYGCLTDLSDNKLKFSEWDGKPFCRRCFEKIPFQSRRNAAKYKESEKKYHPIK